MIIYAILLLILGITLIITGFLSFWFLLKDHEDEMDKVKDKINKHGA